MKPNKLIFGIAASVNVISLFLPWWSDFEIYTRIQKDIFLVGSLSYKVDSPPNVWQYPSRGSLLIFRAGLWSINCCYFQ
jgi:hypothetical protein